MKPKKIKYAYSRTKIATVITSEGGCRWASVWGKNKDGREFRLEVCVDCMTVCLSDNLKITVEKPIAGGKKEYIDLKISKDITVPISV